MSDPCGALSGVSGDDRFQIRGFRPDDFLKPMRDRAAAERA